LRSCRGLRTVRRASNNPHHEPKDQPMLTAAELRKRLDQTRTSLEGLRRYL